MRKESALPLFSGFGVKIAARCPQVAICKYYDEYYSYYYSDFKVTDEVLRRNAVLPQNRIDMINISLILPAYYLHSTNSNVL